MSDTDIKDKPHGASPSVGSVTFGIQNGLVPPTPQGRSFGGGQDASNWRWLIVRVEALEKRVAELEGRESTGSTSDG